LGDLHAHECGKRWPVATAGATKTGQE
jgi:hypothetical protein